MSDSPIQHQEEEITLKELILIVQEYWKELWKNWFLIGVVTLPFIGYFAYKTITHTPTYSAEVRFIVEGQGSSNLGGLGGLLGTIGIGRNSTGKTNPYQILEVTKSKRMVGEVLFSKAKSNSNFIANNIIDLYDLTSKWKDRNPEMPEIEFTDGNIENFNKSERQAFLSLFRKTIGQEKNQDLAMLKTRLNDESGIFSIISTTKDESLSLDLSNTLYKRTKIFFEEQILEDQVKALKVLREKADSLNYLIETKSRAIARFEDSSRGIISNERQITRQKLQAEIAGHVSASAELQKSVEIADYELQNTKPLFLIIDQPYSPIKPVGKSLFRNLIIGGIIGGIIGIIIVLSLIHI